MGHAAIDDDRLVHALIDGIGHAADLGDHAARNDAGGLIALDLGHLHLGDEGALVVLIPQQARDIGHGYQLLRFQRNRDLRSGGVGVHVVGLTQIVHAHRGDHGDEATVQQACDQGGVHMHDLAHMAQLGHVGEIVHVDATLIASLLDGGFIPVIATVGMDDLGQAYNVNADTAAAQIAIALKAEKLVSMTDIAGLLRDKDDESTLIPEVEVSEIEGYKSAGIIAGGMIPKIGGMADAIYQGVHEAVIIDGRVPHSILLELFSNRGSGTRFYRRSHRE